MKLRTEIGQINIPAGHISHRRPLLMLGSCFSDNIGCKLRDDLFNVVINPCGTLYNPASIAGCVEKIVNRTCFSRSDLFQHGGLWHSFSHHSRFSSSDPEKALEGMNTQLKNASDCLESLSTAIITLGSTHIFIDRHSGNVVANCHKLPSAQFEERELTLEECVDHFKSIITTLRRANDSVDIIFTVSPIRHTAYGLEANSLSKAKLRVAINQVVNDTKGISYFPAYEIMLDDLRDYRFYDADMKHPSEVAIDYIYEKFCDCTMTDTTKDLARECRKLSRRLSHCPLSAPDSQEALRFREETAAEVAKLAERYPFLQPMLPK